MTTGANMNELETIKQIVESLQGLEITREIDLAIDNTKVVERIIEYKKLREDLDNLIFDLCDRYRSDINTYYENQQVVA